MSAYNRYYFTKKLFPNFLVLIVKKGKYYSYDGDVRILKYIKFKDKINIIKNKKINYLVLDELEIIEKCEFIDNQLNKYIFRLYRYNIKRNKGSNVV